MRIFTLIILIIGLNVLSLAENGLKDGYTPVKFKKVASSALPKDSLSCSLVSPVITGDGLAFCIDKKESKILKFNQDLQFITEFSRSGKGPGEFMVMSYEFKPERLSITETGSLYIEDYNPQRMIQFNGDGNYIRDILIYKFSPPYNYLVGNKAISDNLFTAYAYTFANQAVSAKKQDNTKVYYLLNLEPFKIILEKVVDEKVIDFRENGIVKYGLTGFAFGANAKFVTNNRMVVFAYSQQFLLEIYDMKGTLLTTIADPSKKMGNFTPQEIDLLGLENEWYKINKPGIYKRLMALYEDKKNVIGDVLLRDNEIFVFLIPDNICIENNFPVLVYNMKGELQRKLMLERLPFALWKNFAYFLEEDEEGCTAIVKYEANGL